MHQSIGIELVSAIFYLKSIDIGLVAKKWYQCITYYCIDDIIVFSDYMHSHINDLWRVFKKLKSAGFKLRGLKCLLGQNSVTHLGFHKSANGVAPPEDKTKIIAEWSVPKSTKELSHFFIGILSLA